MQSTPNISTLYHIKTHMSIVIFLKKICGAVLLKTAPLYTFLKSSKLP